LLFVAVASLIDKHDLSKSSQLKQADLVKMKYRALIYERHRGGLCLGGAAPGDLVLVIDYCWSSNVKIFHPEIGFGFIMRDSLLKLEEAECK
jgi:hypothetical protein